MKLLDRPFNNEKCTQKQEEIRLEEERTNQGSNSQIPYSPISIDTIKKYNDYIYLRLGYENVGYSGLYEEFYYEKRFNYENYEDILDYYDYINDR